MTYEQQLHDEAELWGTEAQRMAGQVLPDWRAHRHLLYNVINHQQDIDALLAQIQPGMQTLELGCASGWLTLAMAQRGANATGYDISPKSLQVARDYYATIAHEVPGTVQYDVQDLNNLSLPHAAYDVVVVKGTLHHLVNMPQVIAEVHQSLKPGGLFWVSDEAGDVNMRSALFSSALMFLLPTQVSYREKFGGLLKFGLNAPSRIKASMEAEDLSPFEGAGREHDWLALVQAQFADVRVFNKPAVTGYLAHQINLSRWLAIPLLRMIGAIDSLMVRIGLLKNTGVVVYARK
ncbi:methyltransferase domain-containing protein [Phototrophicus methaneseepsis]|uniref:Methyltransferase domain-containing protein n=1 Tax=Phototrophicus methaneseepsis TaxID=2710758 RepID=A0A7S8EC89_9CHLR|nr:class I SAM-dependent methyltransferase [Phototrophicus methaneseepsis]QPC84318.1 methyltransferase domain-containing protein [Phototrophicus methaneseepsis]